MLLRAIMLSMLLLLMLFSDSDNLDLSVQVIVPEEANSMLLGAAMLGMAAGEEEGLEAVVRKLQKISKVTELNNADQNQS